MARPLRLRAMDRTDLQRVWRIDQRAFGRGAWPLSAFQGELRNPLARYVVLEAGDRRPLLGYLGCWVIPQEVQIVTIAVDPTSQGLGLGAVLLICALDLACETDADRITLECRESNAAARGLYAKYGFQVEGRRPRYYEDNQEDALILTAPDVRTAAYRELVDRRRHALRRRRGLTWDRAVTAGPSGHATV